MSQLATDPYAKKISAITRPLNLPFQQVISPNINPPEHQSKGDKRKKNHNLQSLRFLSSQLPYQFSQSLEKQNSQPQNLQSFQSRQKNRQIIQSKAPFANATNTKPLQSLYVNCTNSKISQKTELVLKQTSNRPNRPKTDQCSKDVCENLCQLKPSGPTSTTRKRIKTYRIHISSSSRSKENNINAHNRVLSTSEQKQLLPVQILPISQEKSQSNPGIDQDLSKKLVSNRQKSSQSFMIRKKINSTVLQSQQRGIKESNNSLHWSKNYRKDKFVKDEVIQVENAKNAKNRDQQKQSLKTLVRQEGAQMRKQLKLVTEESQKQNKKLQVIKMEKSLTMRKQKYQKPKDEKIVYEQILTEPNNKKTKYANLNIQFQKSSEGNFEMSKVRAVEYEKKKMKQLEGVYQRSNYEEEKGSEDGGDNEAELCEVNAFYEMVCKHLPLKPNGNEVNIPVQESELTMTKGIKISKKRVSSIRALKNLYRQVQVQQKSELGESRNAELSRKKQREASCLTHKIKWGTQTKRKESQEEKLQLEPCGKKDKDYQDEGFRLQLESINIESKRVTKKARFIEEDANLQNKQSQRNYQSIGSRSMIIFQDPGISVIVKKNSQLESSAHVYTTIEQGLSKSDQENQATKKQKGKHIDLDSLQLQSLKQLFLELKSNQSIEMEGSL